MKILPFTSPEATLENAGGKGLNLLRLTRAGFAVPRGFIISTGAYREFVDANRLLPAIQSMLTNLSAEDAGALERASAQIRAAFSAGKMPDETQSAVRAAYADVENKPVAVRSSATAEDLPDLSFAGQQDTYLNVIGGEQLLQAVIHCWSSLWTARAIGYRLRNHIDHEEAALAVVVQEMVQSEASGVLFTANPLTGLRNETVIDATLGLGEALVSGQVEPDHYVMDTRSQRLLTKTLGAKKISTRGKTGGGVEVIEENAEARQALSDEEILRVAAIGGQIQQEYGFPQDIEWAFADHQLYILQSRPITSLFPVPEISLDPLIVWFSFGAVQGLVGPMTPLGIDTVRHTFAGAGRMFGTQVKPNEEDILVPAGERLWIKISDVIRHPIGSRVIGGALGFIEPSAGKILKLLIDDPRLGAGAGRMKFSMLQRLSRFALPVLGRFVRNMLRPEKARAEFDTVIEASLASAQIAPAPDRFGRLMNAVTFIQEHIANAIAFLLPHFIPIFAPSIAALNLLNEIAGNDRTLALEITRSLPQNVTTEMDLTLWKTATEIRADPKSTEEFRVSDALTLARRYRNGNLSSAAQNAITRFLEKYGMRGVGEIDFGQPRWREDPTPIMHTLQSYLNIEDASAPDTLFLKGQQAAQNAIEKLAAKARKQSGGWLKEKLVRGAARRIRLLMGARESPKFFIIRAMGIARKALLEAGEEFAQAGVISQANDLGFLKLDELESLARNEIRDWKSLITERRVIYERELRRRQVPRILVSDGRAFYEGLGSETDTGNVITGSPVSPGVAEGVVHVIFDPRGAQLAPGEILVCPGTDPAWTPLFMAAGGLITEVGGMMTHGSVVAREYGIPAVVGVHQATTRLKDGQRVRVDGTTGQIIVLEQ
ncbi:MAG TPA: PEP/pyruvate-binding domain-containing protein [Anaerolineales bacterium]|nr:PEP/pyruvate-binding domain-containing protein [Anaerolineales bacterium]